MKRRESSGRALLVGAIFLAFALRGFGQADGGYFSDWPKGASPQEVGKALAEHPDWLLKTAAGRVMGEEDTTPLDLANPEAANFVEEAILRAVRDFKVDILKIDYNVRVHQGGQSLRDGYLEQESWRHCEVM